MYVVEIVGVQSYQQPSLDAARQSTDNYMILLGILSIILGLLSLWTLYRKLRPTGVLGPQQLLFASICAIIFGVLVLIEYFK